MVTAGALLWACAGDEPDAPPGQAVGEGLGDDEPDEVPADDDTADDGPEADGGASGDADADDDGDGPDPADAPDDVDDGDGPDPADAPDVDDITEELIQAVLDELEVELGEVFSLAADGAEREEVQAAFSGIYTPSLAADLTETLVAGSVNDALVDDPGRPRGEVVALRTIGLDCVNAVVERDMSEVFSDPGDPATPWSISFIPADVDDAPTAWVLAGEWIGDDEVPPDHCDGPLAEEGS